MYAVVGIPCDIKPVGKHPFHAAGVKYVAAVAGGARCLPLLLPALGGQLPLAAALDQFDGVLLTGSLSNVEPQHYAGAASRPGTLHDPARDATTLPLIRRALALGVPLFAICRGLQEVNVALGGSLHQAVHAVPGIRDHREDNKAPVDVQYGPAHPLHVKPGGALARALGGAADIVVNSLHGQGVDRLGEGLVVEASAEDGLVEAFSVSGSRAFALGVQWHPEWKMRENAVSMKLFEAFGRACRERASRRRALREGEAST